MHTTIAFARLTVGALAAQWLNLPAAPDAHIKTEGDYIYIGPYNKLIGYHALPGTLGEQVRISSPSIRMVNPYYISKFETAVLAAGVFELGAFWPNIGLSLTPGEGLESEQYVAAAAEYLHNIIFLAADIPAPIQGEIHTIRFSTDPVRTALVWSFAEITLLDALPVGGYDVVGARLETGTGIAFRVVPIGGPNRPGGICIKDSEDNDPYLQRHGGLGIWCHFEHELVPGIELICSADDVKETIYGYLDLIPTG